MKNKKYKKMKHRASAYGLRVSQRRHSLHNADGSGIFETNLSAARPCNFKDKRARRAVSPHSFLTLTTSRRLGRKERRRKKGGTKRILKFPSERSLGAQRGNSENASERAQKNLVIRRAHRGTLGRDREKPSGEKWTDRDTERPRT